MERYTVSFSLAQHAPIALPAGARLSEHLTVANSPVLFGCRTGICGTCLIEVLREANGSLTPPDEDERELLDIVAPENPRARLACQIALRADLQIRYLGK